MPHSAVAAARAQLEAFRQTLPEYPETAFRGRGVVLVGGGLRYFVPMWCYPALPYPHPLHFPHLICCASLGHPLC